LGNKFKDHSIEIDRETRFYMVTDGFLDQNGGAKGYPYGKKRFFSLDTISPNNIG